MCDDNIRCILLSKIHSSALREVLGDDPQRYVVISAIDSYHWGLLLGI